MSQARHCPSCDAELPEDSRFCIECGRPVAEAATGATQRIVDREAGERCPQCGTVNPAGARYCVACGAAFGVAPGAPQPLTVPPLPAAPAVVTAPPARRPNAAMWGGIGGGLFVIGLGVLFLTGWWWPGILVLLGVTALVSSAASGEARGGVQGAIFFLGLAVLAQFDWWWPGILILIGLMAILSAVLFTPRRRR